MKTEDEKNLEIVYSNNLNGSATSDKDLADETINKLYQVLEDLPKPERSFKLNNRQKFWWAWFGLEFIKTNQLTKLDLMHLQRAAFWMDARSQAIAKINAKGYSGLVQVFATGANNVSGHVSIIEKADKALEDVSSHFGLSIKDRSKLKQPSVDPGQLDLFDQFLQANSK
jgi:phage terminase small subunit